MTNHTLAAGTADDHSIKFGECYTGPEKDQTPEIVTKYNDPEWSVMAESAEYISGQRTAFSIEELLTVDFTHIPSIDE